MKARRHRSTETTIETHEIWIVRRPTSPLTLMCGQCAQPAAMLSPEEAARQLRLNPRTIYRWIETGKTHFREIENGWLLVCMASLTQAERASPA